MYGRPAGTSTEELRAAINEHDAFLNYTPDQLVEIELESRDKAVAILKSRGNQPLLASEQRNVEALTERADAAQRLHAQHVVDFNRRRGAKQGIEAERADTRARLGIGANPAMTDDRFGYQIRQAIGEVMEGRATAFVDGPTETRALYESGDAGAGVAQQMFAPVSTLRARSIVMNLPGLSTVAMTTDKARWPRIGGATADGTAEGATLTAANTQTDAVDVVAQKFSSYEELSTELVDDYSTEALGVFGQNLLNQLALRVDLGLLEGNGAADCVGIRNTVGANSTSVAATPANFAKFRDAEYELRLDNGLTSGGGVWVMHPRTWKTLSAVKTGISSDETTLLEPDPQQGPKTLLGFPVAFSTQITLTEGTNGSWAALLDTSQLLVAERRAPRLEISRDFKFDQDVVAVRATWRGNLVALNPEAISLLTDIRA